MTQHEFESRTMVKVSSFEFEAINTVYMASEVDKDEFCKIWVKMNTKRVNAAKEARKREEAKEMLRSQVFEIYAKRFLPDFPWRANSIDFLHKSEIAILKKIGIEMEHPVDPFGVHYYKDNCTVWGEMMKFMNVA